MCHHAMLAFLNLPRHLHTIMRGKLIEMEKCLKHSMIYGNLSMGSRVSNNLVFMGARKASFLLE